MVASEVRTPAEQFAIRLRKLGASPDEVTTVLDNWDRLDPDDDPDPQAWTAARRASMAYLPDVEVASMIRASRDEYTLGTTTEADAELAADAAAYRVAVLEASGRIGGNVDSILCWVADQPARAQAVFDLEVAAGGARRGPLVAALHDLLSVAG